MDGVQLAGIIVNATLALLTAGYVFLTYQISKKSATSAQASLDAAVASQKAAEAAHKSALIAEATLPLTFIVSPSRRADGEVWVTCKVEGASVWLHSSKLVKGTVYETEDAPGREIPPAELEKIGGGFPRFLEMGGAGVSLKWPNSNFRLSDYGCVAFIEVQYSYAKDSEKQLREVRFLHPANLFSKWNEKTKQFPDRLKGSN